MNQRTMPDADEVAIAIVTACRITKEDPIAVIEQVPMLRARHYAMHALVHVFPDVPRAAVARCVGAPGLPDGFYKNSLSQKFKPVVGGPRVGKRQAQWWSEDSFMAVIDAIRRPVDLPATKEWLRPTREERVVVPISKSPTVKTVQHKPTNSFGSMVPRPAATPGKRDLIRELQQAILNTGGRLIGDEGPA
jgi:hypothetical protein